MGGEEGGREAGGEGFGRARGFKCWVVEGWEVGRQGLRRVGGRAVAESCGEVRQVADMPAFLPA